MNPIRDANGLELQVGDTIRNIYSYTRYKIYDTRGLSSGDYILVKSVYDETFILQVDSRDYELFVQDPKEFHKNLPL